MGQTRSLCNKMIIFKKCLNSNQFGHAHVHIVMPWIFCRAGALSQVIAISYSLLVPLVLFQALRRSVVRVRLKPITLSTKLSTVN